MEQGRRRVCAAERRVIADIATNTAPARWKSRPLARSGTGVSSLCRRFAARACAAIRSCSGRSATVKAPSWSAIQNDIPSVAIGLVLDVATLTAVDLCIPEAAILAPQIDQTDDRLALMPASTRKPRRKVDDDF